MQGVLLSEVAQIHAQIGNLEVHQPQDRHDAESEGRELPLSIQCYAMKESCAPSSGNRSPGRLPMQGVLPSEVAQIHTPFSTSTTMITDFILYALLGGHGLWRADVRFWREKRPALALYLLESVTVKGSMEELKTMSQTAGIREIWQMGTSASCASCWHRCIP